jgi:hypothetical protein
MAVFGYHEQRSASLMCRAAFLPAVGAAAEAVAAAIAFSVCSVCRVALSIFSQSLSHSAVRITRDVFIVQCMMLTDACDMQLQHRQWTPGYMHDSKGRYGGALWRRARSVGIGTLNHCIPIPTVVSPLSINGVVH